jgi:ABC-2 type transport system permease protein
MSLVRQTWYMTQRGLRQLFRQPVWVAITLVQPMIWILLYGQLFKYLGNLPQFGGSYIDYLTPGIVIMTALFSGGWSGFGVIEDINRGITDRFLVTPVRRGALTAGRLVQLGIIATIQSAILLIVGLLLGANYTLGVIVVVVAAILLGGAFGMLSTALGLIVRREETLIAAVNFIILPLTFLSTVFIAKELIEVGWIRAATSINPVEWAVTAGRSALAANPDWSVVGQNLLYLAVFLSVTSVIAVRSFRVYQRVA